ncbi:class I SAM-dependent methyltransferase [soil metagenome]
MTGLACPLCSNTSLQNIPDENEYFLCLECYLIFLDPGLRKDSEEEKNRYLLHQNSSFNLGYVDFLNQLIEPALPLLDATMTGLDFGCGPSPVLSEILKNYEFCCEYYDPFFFPIDLKEKYHFIFSTECFEHFYSPAMELNRLTLLLPPGGYLLIMTEWWKNLNDFKNWYYKRDYTHVCFYHFRTIKFIAFTFGYNLIFNDGKRLAILKKYSIQS